MYIYIYTHICRAMYTSSYVQLLPRHCYWSLVLTSWHQSTKFSRTPAYITNVDHKSANRSDKKRLWGLKWRTEIFLSFQSQSHSFLRSWRRWTLNCSSNPNTLDLKYLCVCILTKEYKNPATFTKCIRYFFQNILFQSQIVFCGSSIKYM